MGKINEKLEKKLKDIETKRVIYDLDYDPKLEVKIVLDPRYKSAELEFSSKPKQPATSKPISYKSGIQLLIEELKNHKTEYFHFTKTKNNPNDYIITQLNASEIKTLAFKPYIEYIYDDSPIMPVIRGNKKSQKEENMPGENKDKQNNKMDGYHRGSKELPEESDDKYREN